MVIVISNDLATRRQQLSSAQQNLSGLQSKLSSILSQNSKALSQLDRLQAAQSSLSSELQTQTIVFNALAHLFDQYRESSKIIVPPSIVITKAMSVKELAHNDLKEAVPLAGENDPKE